VSGILTAVLYATLTATVYSLFTQALIMSWLWSRYPPRLAYFMSCPSCSGFWYGVGCGALGYWQGWPFLNLPGQYWLTPILVGFCAYWWTPVMARIYNDAYEGLTERDTSDVVSEKP